MAQNVNSTAPNLLTVASNHATVYSKPTQAKGWIDPFLSIFYKKSLKNMSVYL